MSVVQICEEEQEQVFELLSAVLWLGNITFCVVEPDNHVVVKDKEGSSTSYVFYILFFILIVTPC